MSLYVALTGGPEVCHSLSLVVGVFSSEAAAKEACQDDQDQTAELPGGTPTQLVWSDDYEAHATDGRLYGIALVDLDVPV